MKKTDQDVFDLENLNHAEHALAAETHGDKTASLERLLAAATSAKSDHHEREEDSPYQNIEKQVVENDMMKTSINDGRHFENVNTNSNNDRPHNAQPKVSSIINFRRKFPRIEKKMFRKT